ncbi:hypothetical protein NDU88_002333 [Pleurodeles waltl]|uniref:Uncharacterized protein n=1 Tax=Pleurodeles waltl TaxID=8319 RepID=A0AAV7MMG0_PLEWA|nr:hypothetical protein NDU88_002333 [Pleurodeles waltl]
MARLGDPTTFQSSNEENGGQGQVSRFSRLQSGACVQHEKHQRMFERIVGAPIFESGETGLFLDSVNRGIQVALCQRSEADLAASCYIHARLGERTSE